MYQLDTHEAQSELGRLPCIERKFEDLATETDDLSVLDLLQKFIDENDQVEADSEADSDDTDVDEVEPVGCASTSSGQTSFKQTTIKNFFSQSQ